MPRTNHQKGLCNCGGFLQETKDKLNVFCKKCYDHKKKTGFSITMKEYIEELNDVKDDNYKWRDESDNLNDLNNYNR